MEWISGEAAIETASILPRRDNFKFLGILWFVRALFADILLGPVCPTPWGSQPKNPIDWGKPMKSHFFTAHKQELEATLLVSALLVVLMVL